MLKVSNYKMSFDIWGLGLFFIIMIPNFIWFAVPAVNDVLRNESVTPHIDTIASIFQVVTVAALCVIVNKTRQKPMSKAMRGGIIILIILYYIGWCLYYVGIVNPCVILDLCIAPCLTFVLFSIARKNCIALIASSVFMLCHVFYGIINFVV